MGPTASGKTGIAVELVQQLPLEIVSVDSALIYRDMNIGTAKLDDELLKIAPHRLIDIRDPDETYSAADFRDDALREMEDIVSRGNTPLLVGGTLLYFRALEKGLSELPAANAEIRAQLEAQAAEHGWAHMHTRLQEIDPVSATRIHPNDPQRIQRALEVYEISGYTLTELHQKDTHRPAPYDFLKLILAPSDRQVLHARIAERFQSMLNLGFIDEVRALRSKYSLTAELPSMRAVGYRQAWEYLEGKLGEEEWVQQALIATRQYAKRQMTWCRSENDVHWIDTLDDAAGTTVKNLIINAGAMG